MTSACASGRSPRTDRIAWPRSPGPAARAPTGSGDGAADALFGGGGRDRLDGGRGDDQLGGDGGRDTLRGGPGDDTLYDTTGGTIVDGGPGDDRVNMLNRRPGDRVSCGAGRRDSVFYDRGDRVAAGCEFAYPNSEGAPRSPTEIGR